MPTSPLGDCTRNGNENQLGTTRLLGPTPSPTAITDAGKRADVHFFSYGRAHVRFAGSFWWGDEEITSDDPAAAWQ